MSKLVKTSNFTGFLFTGNNFVGRQSPNTAFRHIKIGYKDNSKSETEFNSDNNQQGLKDYATAVDRDIKNIIDYVNRIPKTYIQATEPTIPSDTFSFWKDTDDSKFYLLVNIDGTQKKVEMT